MNLTFSYGVVNASTFIFVVEDSDFWHASLGYVNVNTIKRMMTFEFILKHKGNIKDKRNLCVKPKKVWNI